MNFPIWMLLGFTIWTMAVLLFTVGIYRWSRILSGKVEIKEFRADSVQGEEWYLRSMRAHANCVENLPIFGAVVFALHVAEVSNSAIDIMAAIVLVSRILQSIVHVALVQTNAIAFIRFVLFFAQLVCFIVMAGFIVNEAL